MSNTIVDMPKVTQMLDSGWQVLVFKNPLGSYTAEAAHVDQAVMDRTRTKLIELVRERGGVHPFDDVAEYVDDFHYDNGKLMTDDFTPEQALTRLAYKAVGGEIL